MPGLKSAALPKPNDAEVAAFQRLYSHRFGVDLPYEEANARLTHLVQVYYLTGGHELHKRNQRVQSSDANKRHPRRNKPTGAL